MLLPLKICIDWAVLFFNRKGEIEQEPLARAAGRQVAPGAEIPYEDGRRVVVGHIVARFGGSRLVVGPCILCSLRSGVALAPEILFFAPLSIGTKQEPLKTKQASNLKASIFTRMTQQQHHKSLSQLVLRYSDYGDRKQCHAPEPWGKSTTQILLSNPQPQTTTYNTSGTSNIIKSLQEALGSLLAPSISLRLGSSSCWE